MVVKGSNKPDVSNVIAEIRKQDNVLKKALESNNVMLALKHISMILSHLKRDDIYPKQYYEIYMIVFDSLSTLCIYITDKNLPIENNDDLMNLYELVQYSGNILPRLYLMIAIGSVFLNVHEKKKGSYDGTKEKTELATVCTEILKDMIEMSKGIQNPIKGLFLRYYLSQMTKNFITDGDEQFINTKFKCDYIIDNFIEMNKLWTRLKHKGPSSERTKRSIERDQLKILVGSQLVRLSQVMDDTDIQFYEEEILPKLLQQFIQCNDTLSQEYLFDVLFQVFPLDFHIKTLKTQLLPSILKLNVNVSIDAIMENLIHKIIDSHDNGELLNMQFSELFEILWNFMNEIDGKRPDLPLQQVIKIMNNNIFLTFKLDDHDVYEELELIYNSVWKKFEDYGIKNINSKDLSLVKNFLLLKNHSNLISDHKLFFYQLIQNCNSYTNLLHLQPDNTKIEIVSELIKIFLDQVPTSRQQIEMKSNAELEKLLKACDPMLENALKVNEKETSNDVVTINNSWTLSERHELLTKFCHYVLQSSPNKTTLTEIESVIDMKTEFLLILKNWLYKSGKITKYAFPAIIVHFSKLIRLIHSVLNRYSDTMSEELQERLQHHIKQLFKYISRCITDIFNACSKDVDGNSDTIIDLTFKLNLQSASLADQLNLNEISYDFFSQGFTIYEESITDSKAQFEALVYLAQTLQKTRSFYDHELDYYNNLIVRCTLHASKLLKKQDQCRAVYLCSHLWWATELSSRGEEEGVTKSFHRQGNRVLECLQRSLRVADSIMDNIQSSELMIEILSRCIYFFVHSTEESNSHITVSYINGLIELINTNLNSLKLESSTMQDTQSLNVTDDKNINNLIISADGSVIKTEIVGTTTKALAKSNSTTQMKFMLQLPIQHFERICEYIVQLRQVDDRFHQISI